MPEPVIFAAAVVAFAAFLRIQFYVRLADGLALGLVFCGLCFLFAHLTA